MENNKNVVKEEELEKVTGGALAGLSITPAASQIKFTEPVSPYANNTPEILANSAIGKDSPEILANTVTVKNPNVIDIPVYNGGAIKTK